MKENKDIKNRKRTRIAFMNYTLTVEPRYNEGLSDC